MKITSNYTTMIIAASIAIMFLVSIIPRSVDAQVSEILSIIKKAREGVPKSAGTTISRDLQNMQKEINNPLPSLDLSKLIQRT